MTRLLHAKHSHVTEFIKRLDHAGLTAEQISTLATDPKRMREWVAWLGDKPERISASRDTPLHTVFERDPTLVNVLAREDIKTLGELADCTFDEIRYMSLIGGTRMTAIEAVLEVHGLSFSEAIDNGARRVYRDAWRTQSSCRRDRLGTKPISDFVKVSSDTQQLRRDVPTIDAVKAMSDSELSELYGADAVKKIRDWIAANVY